MPLAGLALLLPLFLQATPSPSDEGFRCPSGRLVSVGDRLSAVRERCGEPDASEKRTETRRREDVVTVEEWTYELGEGRLSRHLRFENGKLVEITTGSRQAEKTRRP